MSLSHGRSPSWFVGTCGGDGGSQAKKQDEKKKGRETSRNQKTDLSQVVADEKQKQNKKRRYFWKKNKRLDKSTGRRRARSVVWGFQGTHPKRAFRVKHYYKNKYRV